MPDKLLLIVDLQVGLFNIVRDYAPTEYVNNMMGYASLGRVFDIPVFMMTSAEQGMLSLFELFPFPYLLHVQANARNHSISGPNGALPKEMIELYPDALLIKRQGEVNAWDNSEFHAAVRASGKKQIMIEGITTDVCKSTQHQSLIPSCPAYCLSFISP